jgi:hypothetical protein
MLINIGRFLCLAYTVIDVLDPPFLRKSLVVVE